MWTPLCLNTDLCARHGQSMTSTEIQQHNTAPVQVRGAILPDHAKPGLTVAANVAIKVTQEDDGIPRRSTLQYPPNDSKKSLN